MSRLVVAAPASGCGKTTVATGLIAALRARGTAVAPFKVGPDYIDPGYHALAAGRPGRNLDPVLVGAQRIVPLFAHGVRGAEIAVVEGVMGLFDGRVGTEGAGSTAEVATLLAAPAVLVVDARGQGRSLAALLHGFRGYDPAVRIGGVVLNRVGSARHEEVLREACAEVGLPVLGALPRDPALAVPSRHLGLVTAAEHGAAAVAAVRAIGDAVAAHVDLDAVVRLAGTAPPLTAPPWDPAAEVAAVPGRPVVTAAGRPVGTAAGRPVVAVAGGPAFTFGYAEHVELLRAAGADVAVVDPVRDEALPEGTSALVLPGGFPEQHAADLAANRPLRTAVAALAERGAPVHAECGGLLYLARELDGQSMCGVLDAEATMSGRLTLGYRDAVAAADSALYPAGARVTGHEFHRTALRPGHGATPAWHWRGGTEGFVSGRVHASYLHTHPAGNPESVTRFVAAATQLPAPRTTVGYEPAEAGR
ncbi:cobyrinate a,c-diamide synthase [Gandjariella thermophila]|uniref:cobyrinate a,c-diamide synthase n=1 Tax=Gandjariella thermophila TaxID=1931992 RepID=UPI0026BC9851